MPARRARFHRRAATVVVAALALAGAPSAAPNAAAEEPQVTRDVRVAMSDGVALEVKVGGRGPLIEGERRTRPSMGTGASAGSAAT